ncbi:MAG: VOC family protein [Acidimicrobiia bacterium]|nr:VOC family protein [Acidimicrobiia bacterium]
MRIKGIIWVGSATDDRAATAEFFSNQLGMEVTVDVAGFTQLMVENGDRLELFGPDSREHDQLDTGPVAGFWVDDIELAHRELTEAQVDVVTKMEQGRDGHRWFYFRAPDGNFYELCEHPRPRLPKTSL